MGIVGRTLELDTRPRTIRGTYKCFSRLKRNSAIPLSSARLFFCKTPFRVPDLKS